MGESDGDKRKIQGFDENKGIVIVCANCLIRMVNEASQRKQNTHQLVYVHSYHICLTALLA